MADFLQSMEATRTLEWDVPLRVQIRFGDSIDQDDRPDFWFEPVAPNSVVERQHSIVWDIEVETPLADVFRLLHKDNRTMCRAFLHLGRIPASVTESLQIARPDDGEMNLCLWSVSFAIGPSVLSSLSSDKVCKVGWMDLSIGGDGYLWPWCPRDLTDRAMGLSELQSLANVCRESFPVDAHYTGPLFSERHEGVQEPFEDRRRLGERWPFDRIDAPCDWFWGVSESG